MCDRDHQHFLGTNFVNDHIWKSVKYSAPNVTIRVGNWKLCRGLRKALDMFEHTGQLVEELVTQAVTPILIPTGGLARLSLCHSEEAQFHERWPS
jgi:hypothetical protein